MKIPEKIKVGNITYRVTRREEEHFLGSHEIEGSKQVINVIPNICADKERNVFFHELTHAILYQAGGFMEYDNEYLVQSMANILDNLFELKKK
jgi:hypothetical protein